MAKIHELSDVLADQIAAGEVVERPASVVKELVENAIDAHSTQIDILVEEAGLKSIEIVDNGDGIATEDVPLAFERHATSKITTREDLFKVRSLGFRGEALPSIASVADVVLETSTGDETGTQIHIKGGQVVDHSLAAVRKGTDISVKDLFFNTPARLKYMKSPQTELANISDIVNRLALSYPEIAFTLSHEGRELIRTSGRGDLLQVIAGIYGVQNARKMVQFKGENVDFEISGYTSLPEFTRASRQYISVLINGRYVKNFQVTKAIIEGYGSKLMVGRYPVAVLNIKMDPLLVDVNVHPAKQEVRISQEPQLQELITKVIYKELAKENLIPSAVKNLSTNRKVNTDQLQFNLNEASAKYSEFTKPASGVANVTEQQTASLAELFQALPSNGTQPIVIKHETDLKSAALTSFQQKYTEEAQVAPFDEDRQVETAEVSEGQIEQEAETKRFPILQYVGQMHGTFLFAESEEGLYILDQHAAQERINYEYYREEIGKVSTDSQSLLVPIVLDYATSDVLKIQEKEDVLASCGIQLESFGPNSFVVRQHPTWFKAGQEEDTVREMIDYVLNDSRMTVAKFREKTAIMMSCKRAIKANHHLDDQQARQLIQDLAKTENPFNCPHGRPVLVHFSNSDMKKMFKRIQDPHRPLEEQE
ncbi:DNA mismatch repair endonuclease MutL [Pediococcus inopinatus]|uniref:DNA mismatch repair protein MutL n=1 Tax=Pediococcus inopinatus TaxID=114090 RepID=A0ABZ0Q2K5_9LACO|nr:DNA mismatch repair endonuclease MutL [Pediococcus inopinatus]AVL00255.1 DNA mismatch repair protein MutL [Pediococcus inopinatus]KRN60957.1 DNA mismatch repair protein [Pediococcus inopinatus]WPC19373.1 DNA mismatch repair endonuclease MutL [Pediococcus inopinatus]WPC21166.1 DNA mismatch repair endonuclease MutL [Pediococcus inopinatus]WPP09907.1 DNA mismatch repair endonuclease MutL [Pediococcus inopinatus]